MNNGSKMGRRVFLISLALISAVFLVVGIICRTNVDNFMGTSESVEARICDIDTYKVKNRKGFEETRYKVYVDYTVDGVTYDHIKLDKYDSSMNVGKIITIYYDPESPGHIMSGDSTASTVMIFAGVCVMVVAILITIITMVKESQRKKLITGGTVCKGRIINVRELTDVTIDDRHPFKAECEVTDPATQERFVISTEEIYSDIRAMAGMPVVVYIDNNDPSKYIVDVDKMMADYEDWRRKR